MSNPRSHQSQLSDKNSKSDSDDSHSDIHSDKSKTKSKAKRDEKKYPKRLYGMNSAKGKGKWFRILLILVITLFIILMIMWYRNKHKINKQEEFKITYAPKMHHPWTGTGDPLGFVINGYEGGTLNLKRNTPYKFIYASPDAQAHPFYFTTSSVGGIGDNNRIPKSPEINKEGEMMITFGKDYPDTFYYQSANDPSMGGIVKLFGH